MVGQGDDRPPLWAVVRLTVWATANKHYLLPKIRARQIDPDRLSIKAMLGLIYQLMVAEFSSAWVAPSLVREKIDEFLNEPGIVPVDAQRRAKQVDAAMMRANWGRSPEAIAGQRAAMELTGGLPARRRAGG